MFAVIECDSSLVAYLHTFQRLVLCFDNMSSYCKCKDCFISIFEQWSLSQTGYIIHSQDKKEE